MRRLMLGAVLALALPAAALAQGGPSATSLATKACKTEKSAMGTNTFKKTYAAKSAARAMKACLAKQGVVAEKQISDAAFAGKYAVEGVNHNGRNAYGKCVSSKAKAASAEATEDRIAAARTCKTESADKAAFAAEFGSGKNAFGKCVSKTAKELAAAEQG